MLVCVAGVVGTARAQSRVANWPDSPVRNTLRETPPSATPSFAANLRGGVATAGNTLETCPANLAPARKHGARAAAHKLSARAGEPCLTADNNNNNMQYVNVDPSGGHFNSSTATLTVPGGARVARAFLYWGADLARGVNRPPNGPSDDAPGGASPATNPLYTRALLRTGTGSYAAIDATAPGRDGRWDYVQSWYQQPGQSLGWSYQARADVTAEVSAALAAPTPHTRAGGEQLPVTVANVQAGRGYNRHGGWTLLVVWESPTAAWRNITLFDGFDFVQVQGGQQLVVGPLNLSGFQTPASGKVDAHVTVWAYEGDRGITGDYMALGGLSSSCAGLPKLSDAAHPVSNFFNSTISSGGVTVGGRTPGYDNQLGFDLATLNLPEGTIPNGATGASICLGTVGDTYFFGGIAFDTLIRAPNVQIAKVPDRTQANPGDVVTYTTTVTNPSARDPSDPLFGTPVDAATNLVVADQLPAGLDFVGLTVNPGGACSYTDATRTINCSVGRLAPDASFSYAYKARVNASAQGSTPASLVNTACYQSNSEDEPTVVYDGCADATVVVPPAPPPPPQADLGVIKSVSDDIVAPGATLTWHIVGTNYGPSSSTGFVLSDQLPPSVAFVSATPSAPLTCTTPPLGGSGSIVCTATSVPAAPAQGSSPTLTIVATVPSTTADGTVLTNIATVQGDQQEPVPDPHPNRAQVQTRVVVPDQPLPPPPPPPPDPIGPIPPPVPPPVPPPLPPGPAGTRLALRKQATAASVSPGGTVAFRLRVSNIGEAEALNVRVCDTLPRGLAAVAAPGFMRDRGALCATLARLPDGASRVLRLTARVAPGAPGVLTNRAAVLASNTPSASAQTAIRVRAKPPRPAFTG